MDLFSTDKIPIQLKDAEAHYYPDFLTSRESDDLLALALNEFPWQGGEIKIFGKTFDIPRREVYFGDEGKHYSYSGKTLSLIPWQKDIFQLKTTLEKTFELTLNACLANLYRDGLDSNGWHADDEPELGEHPIIASISLGATRKFQIKHKQTDEKTVIDLSHGSLLLMGKGMQAHYKHQIPKQKKVRQPRVNLTFRNIIH
ncbi:MAG: alpha-ketoglutarate-dependent dioxygenase AlkB [Crocinitomicaceae bacterium]|nr:alpha-ketoglutarate-dependent dioxygenase AlkB [Crocinitomicaceae bacterium]